MVRALMHTGLATVALSVVGLIVSDTEMGGDHRVFLTKALVTGAALFAATLFLRALGKIGAWRLARRCPRCKHAVRPGHVYCEDHFQESLFRGRDHLAGRSHSVSP